MLFDLRSRRRRGAVRVIYLFLAIVMVAGLVLVGVGTGSNSGGLLNAFTNNGSSSGQNDAITSQVGAALKEVKKHPNAASSWSALVQARWAAAGSGSNYNSTTDTYTSGGKKQLQYAATDWIKYLSLVGGKPSLTTSILAARVYQNLSEWANASTAWEYAAGAETGGASAGLSQYFCMALNSYAGGLSEKGDLASAEVKKLAPALRRLSLEQTLKEAKSSATTAQETVSQDC
jgi:hypothetical protein